MYVHDDEDIFATDRLINLESFFFINKDNFSSFVHTYIRKYFALLL